MKILLISYLFPPAGGIAVQRALSLAKYLPGCGCEVHVLRASNAAVPVRDEGLLRHVPDCVKVHGAFTPEIPFAIRQRLWHKVSGKGSNRPPSWWKKAAANTARRILCPEPEILWAPFAVRKAWSIIRRHQIDTVLITAPPFSAFVVGVELKRRAPGLRLISDFRDEWLDFYLKDFDFQNGAHTRRRAAAIERQTIEASDLVVSTTLTTRDVIRRRYPEQPDNKFAVVAHGYDPEVFADFRSRPRNDGKLVVTHVGTVYKTACPRYYLDALDGLDEPVRSRITTRFVGRVAEDERAGLEGHRSAVEVVGFLPQAQALRYMEDTDCLLLTMTNDISLPGKLFEYMATGKRILALCAPGSEVAKILDETGAGLHADPFDKAAIRRMIAQVYDDLQHGRLHQAGIGEAVRRYERPRLTADYVSKIRNCSGALDTQPCLVSK